MKRTAFEAAKIVKTPIRFFLAVALVVASVSAVAAARAPNKQAFEAILWGGNTTPERSWIDGHGILHIRNMVITYTGIPGPGGPPYWYPGSITDMSYNIIGTITMAIDVDIDLYSTQPTGDGRLAMTGEAILYGEHYKMRTSGSINEMQFSIPFLMVGEAGSITGKGTGTMGYPAVILSGTWIQR